MKTLRYTLPPHMQHLDMLDPANRLRGPKYAWMDKNKFHYTYTRAVEKCGPGVLPVGSAREDAGTYIHINAWRRCFGTPYRGVINMWINAPESGTTKIVTCLEGRP